ncbi:MAG: hypothetical protein U1E05_23945 [Patescibacteria group bacterium]|nr:hypothetical protein [Patescibacteria group bacterium]
MVLRVRGPGRPGQLVRLRSTKCSVGSGPRCTLRLAARGVRAVHCVIFRGTERTIVRRWAPDTRLNGHAFTDSELHAGDRLSIGPIEVDVLDTDGPMVAREGRHSPREADRPADAQLAQLRDELNQRDRDLDGRREALEREFAKLDAQRNEQMTDLRQRQERLDADLACLGREYADWDQRRQSDEQALRARGEQLAELRRELDQREANSHQEHGAIQAAEEDLQAKRAQLDVQQQRVQADFDRLRAEEEAFKAECEKRLQAEEEALRNAREQLEGERRNLQADLDRLQAEQQALPAEQQSLQAEQDRIRAAEEAIHADRQRLQTEEETLRQDREQLEGERRNLQADLDRLQAEQQALQAKQQGFQAEQADLQAERERIHEEEQRLLQTRQEWEQAQSQEADAEPSTGVQAELAERRNRLDEEQQRLEGERTRLEADRASLIESRETLQRDCEEWERTRRQREEQFADREAELDALAAEVRAERLAAQRDEEAPHDEETRYDTEAQSAEVADAEEDGDEEDEVAAEPREEPPVTLADVLRRLGKGDVLLDDEDDLNEAEVASPHTPLARRGGERSPSAESRFSTQSATGSVHEAEGDDDVSVDEYMSQLMHRVRGTTPQQAGSRRASTDRPEQSDRPDRSEPSRPPASEVERQPNSEKPIKPAKMKPRGPAPERTGFAAMRELANVSARAAVDQHARRQMVSIGRSKLAVTGTAGVTSALLFWLWATYLPIGVTLVGAITSFAIAVLWGLQYAVVTGRLLVSQTGRIRFSRGDSAPNTPATPTDESPMDESPATPDQPTAAPDAVGGNAQPDVQGE